MGDEELIRVVREKAMGLEFFIRWCILELCRRYEARRADNG